MALLPVHTLVLLRGWSGGPAGSGLERLPDPPAALDGAGWSRSGCGPCPLGHQASCPSGQRPGCMSSPLPPAAAPRDSPARPAPALRRGEGALSLVLTASVLCPRCPRLPPRPEERGQGVRDPPGGHQPRPQRAAPLGVQALPGGWAARGIGGRRAPSREPDGGRAGGTEEPGRAARRRRPQGTRDTQWDRLLVSPPLCSRGARHSRASQSPGLGCSQHSASPWPHPGPFA